MIGYSEILQNADSKIKQFNYMRKGPRYNQAAGQIYTERLKGNVNPFGSNYAQHIISGLIAFDMARAGMMGKSPHNTAPGFFAYRLMNKLATIKPLLEPIIDCSITEINITACNNDIIKAYKELAAGGSGALHAKGKHFDVGATKIMHFLNPNLFIIIDRNAAEAYRISHNIDYKKKPVPVPGYSPEKYISCMECAQKDIQSYSIERFKALENSTPLTRIYDKLTFVTGGGIKS
jgi:hypothetical protein